MIRRLCIIGVGLIGGSLARALRNAGVCEEIVGSGRSVGNLEKAMELGVIDRFDTDPAIAAAGADMIVVAVPLGAMEAVFRAIQPVLGTESVLTDAGSAKGCVVDAARAVFGEVPAFLVPGHPIAGTERSGVGASFPELYQGRRVILTPLPETDLRALDRVTLMWQAAGARVSNMEVTHHDAVLAATSHLPHVLAFSLVDTLSRLEEHDEILEYAAGGFRDFSRIASSDPVMWRDICIANRDAILKMIDRYMAGLNEFTGMLREQDEERILETFRRAKEVRDGFVGH